MFSNTAVKNKNIAIYFVSNHDRSSLLTSSASIVVAVFQSLHARTEIRLQTKKHNKSSDIHKSSHIVFNMGQNDIRLGYYYFRLVSVHVYIESSKMKVCYAM